MGLHKGGYQIIDLGEVVFGTETTITDKKIIQIFKDIHKEYLEKNRVKPILLCFKSKTYDYDVCNYISQFITGSGVELHETGYNDDRLNISVVYDAVLNTLKYNIEEI